MLKYDAIFKKNWLIPPLKKVPLAPYTSFRCAGTADILLNLSDEQELQNFYRLTQENTWPWLILGRGSNCIFTADGLKGVLVLLRGKFKEIKVVPSQKELDCGAAVLNSVVARRLQKLIWQGGEFLITIPGTIGGGIVMNAGAHGFEFKDIVTSVTAFDLAGRKHIFDNSDCDFGYRQSTFLNNKFIISSSRLKFSDGKLGDIVKDETTLLGIRKKKQPIHAATWGSVFKNPPDYSAGQLIEECGLKGKGFGNARISKKHANFIENTGKAIFEDVKCTILMAQNAVYERFGIMLDLEVRIIDSNAQTIDLKN